MAIINYMPPARQVSAGSMIFEQVDLFLGDGETRATGVVPANLQLAIHVNSTVLSSWSLVSGVGITDDRVSAGRVYWTQFASGFYSIRLFPHMLGLWRVIVTYPTHDQVLSFTYNVTSAPTNVVSGGGLKVSFTRR